MVFYSKAAPLSGNDLKEAAKRSEKDGKPSEER
jgi:hypothetical protein